jgi:hypothetical protein
MDQNQKGLVIAGTLELLIHNVRYPYNTFSYFEGPLSRTVGKSQANTLTPFIVKLIIFFLIYVRSLELKRLVRRQEEIDGLLSEYTPTPIPRRCYISGHSCNCTTEKCPHYTEPPEWQ